jgi:hypothetical protein
MAIKRGLAGTQYRWTDLRFPFTRDKQGQTDLPDFDFTNLGLLFPQNDATEIAYIIAQFPHEARNSELRPHIHFVQEVAGQPTFQMDYRIIENGDNDAYKAFTTGLTASTFAFTWVSGDLLQVASFPSIDISGLTSVSWFMDIRVYRNDNVVTGDVLAKEFDIHYQTDDWGSRQEFIK